MTLYAVLMLFCVLFVELFIHLSVVKSANQLSGIAGESLKTVSSPTLSDAEKEKVMRTNSLKLIKVTGMILVKFVVISAVLAGIFFLLKQNSANLAGDVAAGFMDLKMLGLLTIWSLLYVWLRNGIIRRL